VWFKYSGAHYSAVGVSASEWIGIDTLRRNLRGTSLWLTVGCSGAWGTILRSGSGGGANSIREAMFWKNSRVYDQQLKMALPSLKAMMDSEEG
jgi:hypothetical protein